MAVLYIFVAGIFCDHLPYFEIILLFTPLLAACDAPPSLSERVAIVLRLISVGRTFSMLSKAVMQDIWYFPFAEWLLLIVCSFRGLLNLHEAFFVAIWRAVIGVVFADENCASFSELIDLWLLDEYCHSAFCEFDIFMLQR